MEKLIADALLEDSRIKEGKRLILEAVKEHTQKISKISEAKSDFKASYNEMLDQIAQARGSKLYYPYIGSGVGNRFFVELADGSVKCDLISGIGVHYFGHNYLEIIESEIDASIQNTIMQGNLQQNRDSLTLMKELVKLSKLDCVFLTTSGAMANENALKIIFQKKQPAYRLLAFEGCFMGRTTLLSQITDKASFREGVPPNVFIDYLPFFDHKDPEGSTDRAIKELRKYLKRYPKKYAAIIMELIQGERGFYPGSSNFFLKLGKICKEEGLCVLIDEVQTFARTPALFAYHHFGLEEIADVVTIGKVAQLGATLWKKEFNPKAGLLSQTFTASTSSIRASLYILNTLVNGGFFGNHGKIMKLYTAFERALTELSARHNNVIHGPYGVGTMIAFTLFDGDQEETSNFLQKLFQNGLIAFIAGQDPCRVRFLLPAGVMDEWDIPQVISIIERTLVETISSRKKE